MYLVNKLSSHVHITGTNVSLDRYFTSVTTAHYFKEKRMTLVGTMWANRKGILKELVEMKNCDDIYIKFAYANEDDMMLTSYVVKKNQAREIFYY